MTVTHNTAQVLRSSKALHKRFEMATKAASEEAAKHIQKRIQAQIPPPQGNGKFPGYAATGTLRNDIIIVGPKQNRDFRGRFASGWSTEVKVNPSGRSAKYAHIHEVGGIIRPRSKPFMVFALPPNAFSYPTSVNVNRKTYAWKGKDGLTWIKTTAVVIRRKRYFATGWKDGARTAPAVMSGAVLREVRVR